jgi:class 3 adenylate cyclase
LNEDENQKKSRMTFRQSTHNTPTQRESGPPIANKFPNATVFFADLAGFTKWSSTREPEQVFELLEAMFKQFDALALRRGVFKVEVG